MRRRGGESTAVLTAVAVVAAVLSGVLLVGWAATVGPGPVLEGPGLQADRLTPSPSDETCAEDEVEADSGECVLRTTGGEPPPPRDESALLRTMLSVVTAIAFACVVALVAGVLWLLGRRAVDAWRGRRPSAAPLVSDAEVLTPAQRLERSVRDAAQEASYELAHGEPDEAVLRCWHRFEVAAADVGLPREEWETAAEFTARALTAARLDPVAIATLAELFREARFSDHALDETARQRARDALDVIRGSLTGRGPRCPPRRPGGGAAGSAG